MSDELKNEGHQQPPAGSLLVYQGQGLGAPVQVRLEGDSVWLSQKLLAELYGVSVPTIIEHIANIYDEEELSPESTIRKFRIVQTEGARQVKRNVERLPETFGFQISDEEKKQPVAICDRFDSIKHSSGLLELGRNDHRRAVGTELGGLMLTFSEPSWLKDVAPEATSKEKGRGSRGDGEQGVGTTPKTTLKTTPKTTQEKILECIRSNPKVTRLELGQQVGVSLDGVKYHIKRLRESGLIRRVGPNNGGHWEVVGEEL